MTDWQKDLIETIIKIIKAIIMSEKRGINRAIDDILVETDRKLKKRVRRYIHNERSLNPMDIETDIGLLRLKHMVSDTIAKIELEGMKDEPLHTR